MASADDLGRDEWEAIMHAPFHAYVHVAGSEKEEPIVAQFRLLVDEINAGQEHFPEGSLGRVLTSTLNANLDALWAGFHASNRSARDGLTPSAQGPRSGRPGGLGGGSRLDRGPGHIDRRVEPHRRDGRDLG